MAAEVILLGTKANGQPKTLLVDDDGKFSLSTPITIQPPKSSTATLTLPGVGGTYAAADEVSNNATAGSVTPLHFADVVNNAGDSAYLVKLTVEVSTAVVSSSIFRLWLFNTSALTFNGNDSPYVFRKAEKGKRVAYIDFSLVTEGTGSDGAYALNDGERTLIETAAAPDLWGIVVAKGAYVWAAAQTFDFTLDFELA